MENSSIQLILGNSNKRFSGVTSTMLQVLPHQKELMDTAILGNHHLPEDTHHLSFLQFIKLCRKPLPNSLPRIFHARRNDEMIQALIAKKLFGAKIKIIFTSTAQRHHSAFTRWLMSKMDAIISTCTAANAYLKNPADIIIPHGIDSDTYTPPNNRDIDSINIGVFGRIRPSKGIDILIDAAIPILKKHPEAKLHICGETTPKFQSYLQEQKDKITSANLSTQVNFIGKVEFQALPKLYQKMHIVCALSRNEGFGLTPLEAMASGAAVLTSEAGAWKDIIQNGTHGYCVPTADIKTTQEKLDLLISNPHQLHEMGTAGRKHIELNYTNKTEAIKLCSFFKKIQQANTPTPHIEKDN